MKVIKKPIIKHILLLCGLFLCLFLIGVTKPTNAATKTYKTGYVQSEVKVKMYSKTSGKSKVVYKLKSNTKIKYYKVNKKWAAVKYKKKTGYVLYKKITTRKPLKRVYTPSYFKRAGVLYWGGWQWTWYSQNVLPGGGLRIPGRHVDKLGYVCDKYDNICLASSNLPYGTIVKTPLGKYGRVYDSGCSSGILDVYVAW